MKVGDLPPSSRLIRLKLLFAASMIARPVWVEPVHGYRTPMCQAVAVAGAHVYEWASAHPDSFPPIIINITDGMVTDSPYEGATLDEWAQRLSVPLIQAAAK